MLVPVPIGSNALVRVPTLVQYTGTVTHIDQIYWYVPGAHLGPIYLYVCPHWPNILTGKGAHMGHHTHNMRPIYGYGCTKCAQCTGTGAPHLPNILVRVL